MSIFDSIAEGASRLFKSDAEKKVEVMMTGQSTPTLWERVESAAEMPYTLTQQVYQTYIRDPLNIAIAPESHAEAAVNAMMTGQPFDYDSGTSYWPQPLVSAKAAVKDMAAQAGSFLAKYMVLVVALLLVGIFVYGFAGKLALRVAK